MVKDLLETWKRETMSIISELYNRAGLKEKEYKEQLSQLDSEKLDDETERIRAQAVQVYEAASLMKSQIASIMLNEPYLSYIGLFKRYPPVKDKFNKDVPFRRLEYLQQRHILFDVQTVQEELKIPPEEWNAILERGDYIELANACVESGSTLIDIIYKRLEESNTKGIGQWGQNLSARMDQFLADYGQLLSDDYSDIATWPEQIQSGYDDYGQMATKAQAALSGTISVLNQMSNDIVNNQTTIKEQLRQIKANNETVQTSTSAAADSDKLMRDHNSEEQRALKKLEDAQQKLVAILKDKEAAEKATNESQQKLRDQDAKISANKDIIEEQTRTIVTLRNTIISAGKVIDAKTQPQSPEPSQPPKGPVKSTKEMLKDAYKKRPVHLTCPKCGNEFDHKKSDPTAKCGKCKMSIGVMKYLDGGYPKFNKGSEVEEDASDTTDPA